MAIVEKNDPGKESVTIEEEKIITRDRKRQIQLGDALPTTETGGHRVGDTNTHTQACLPQANIYKKAINRGAIAKNAYIWESKISVLCPILMLGGLSVPVPLSICSCEKGLCHIWSLCCPFLWSLCFPWLSPLMLDLTPQVNTKSNK